jgi:hypothetical protein
MYTYHKFYFDKHNISLKAGCLKYFIHGILLFKFRLCSPKGFDELMDESLASEEVLTDAQTHFLLAIPETRRPLLA